MPAHRLELIIDDFYNTLNLSPEQYIGIAFSGGGDSVALLAATVALGRRCIALHCNVHLRADESQRDEDFARSMASMLGVPFACTHFNAKDSASQTGDSIEMVCRELRYRWFEQALDNGVQPEQPDTAADSPESIVPAFIALGHHADDNVETVMLNLSRSAGLKGLSGIPQRRERFVRPMLRLWKSDITDYLAHRKLNYVTDSTNLLTDCRRNVWRNILLPAIEAEFPGFAKAVEASARHIRSERKLLDALISQTAESTINPDNEICLSRIAAMPEPASLLRHLLNRNGSYTLHTAESILASWRESRSGKTFYSADGQTAFELHRDTLIPVDIQTPNLQTLTITRNLIETGGNVEHPVNLKFEIISPDKFIPQRDSSAIWLDREALLAAKQPLTLRPWQQGDRIEPFGMKGSRLLSDLFSDNHLSLARKRNTMILTCGEKILWAVGLRASRHFAVSPSTTSILKITHIPSAIV